MDLGSDLHPSCTTDYWNKISVMKGTDCELSGCLWGVCQNSCLTFVWHNAAVPLERHGQRMFRHHRMRIISHQDFKKWPEMFVKIPGNAYSYIWAHK